MGAYSPRKGSLGFQLKRAKHRIPTGNKHSALWFHKAGMLHPTNTERFIPVTILELIETRIVGYIECSTGRLYKPEQLTSVTDVKGYKTKLELSPRFQKRKVYRTVGNYLTQLEPLYESLKKPRAIKVVGTTKGKGFSGVIKVRGIKLGKRKRARANKERHIGAIGGRTGHVTWRAPQAANMGNAKRTYKGYTVSEVPVSTMYGYGIVGTRYICVKGSIPGSVKGIVKVCC